MTCPFEILSCSWPSQADYASDRWTSAPEWDAPLMPCPPEPHLQFAGQELCWMVDWREYFRSGPHEGGNYSYGDLRGFHVVFRVEVSECGRLRFWADDGCIVRRNGVLVHEDRAAHPLSSAELDVCQGDRLEIAQWQRGWDWCWGARIVRPAEPHPTSVLDLLVPHLDRVQTALRAPNGPALKMYTNAAFPVRAVAAIYAIVANGYAPCRVQLYGEYQWPGGARELLAAALPFAEVVATESVLSRLRTLGGAALADLSHRYWFVMKACVGLFCEPEESCLLDDDLFVLEPCHDALEAFRTHELVYTPDQDLTGAHLPFWGRLFGHSGPLRTARFNAGLYWIRNVPDPQRLASLAGRTRPNPACPYVWEQGLIAMAYHNRPTWELPSNRYLFPLFGGFPLGTLGYDWAHNPCGFRSVHFGGLANKPSDTNSLEILPQILAERRDTARPTAAAAGD